MVNKKFFNKLAEVSKREVTDRQRVSRAKKIYLIQHGENMKQAKSVGYSYALIAQAATADLIESGLPESFTLKTKDGEEKIVETKFKIPEIKKFCESEEGL